MPRAGHENDPRPTRVEHEPVVVHSKRPVAGVLDKISAKHTASFNNKKLKKCCQDVMKHEVEFTKSNPDQTGPDRMVFTCSCGRKHIRMGAGGTRAGVE